MNDAGAGGGSRSFAVVAPMALAFGPVGIDRLLISAMSPVIAEDLGPGYGTIDGALAFAWGLAALCVGNVSDRAGRASRPAAVPATTAARSVSSVES